MKDDQEELLSYKDWTILIRQVADHFQIGISRGYTTVIWLDKAVYGNLEEAMTGGLTYGRLIIDKIKHGKFSEGIFK
jgi:hypothetical protein